jgi:rhamnose utilization protein RhaD (predicted bifunctional aldolase and dehydrogenase)
MNNASPLRDSVLSYCAQIGADPLLVQGAGGNVSWKEGDTLWVKASGTWLADALTKDIFVPVDLVDLRAAIQAGKYAVQPKLKNTSALRPSIETLLHALMPQRVVVHIHAIEVLACLVRENCATELANKLAGLSNWSLVPYHKPGAPLAEAVIACLQVAPNAEIIFLANHGLVIGGDNVECVKSTLNKFLGLLTKNKSVIQSFGSENYIQNIGDFDGFESIDISEIHNLALNEVLFARVKNDWALYPDHVVFLGSRADCFDSIEAFNEANINIKDSELIFIRDFGVYIRPSFSSAKKAQLLCYFNTIIRQPLAAQLKSLTQKEIGELLDWDAERYRQNIA